MWHYCRRLQACTLLMPLTLGGCVAQPDGQRDLRDPNLFIPTADDGEAAGVLRARVLGLDSSQEAAWHEPPPPPPPDAPPHDDGHAPPHDDGYAPPHRGEDDDAPGDDDLAGDGNGAVTADAGIDAGSDGGPGDGGDTEDDGNPEPIPAALPDPEVSLRDLPAFQSSLERWNQRLVISALQPGAAPLPPLLSPSDPGSRALQQEYLLALRQRPFTQPFYPFGRADRVPGYQLGETMAGAVSLLLAHDESTALLRLTDFSTPEGQARIAAACERYLARMESTRGTAHEESAAAYREQCAELGTVVPVADVADLRVHGTRLLRASECALPSAVYGAYSPDAEGDGSWRYEWPDFLERPASTRQPCIGLFLDVEARDALGALLGRGFMFVKAVADHQQVPFPYSERDPEHGRLQASEGAPRGEFVSTRWVFDDGAALYNGQTPLWVLPISLFYSEGLSRLAEVIDGNAPACTPALLAQGGPCIASPQAPFLFANEPAALWVRQMLDGTDSRYDADPFAPGRQRNPFELAQVANRDSLRGAMLDILDFFNQTLGEPRTSLERAQDAEQLSAMWHSLHVYRAAFSGFERIDRKRAALLMLDQNTLLAIPDQGYFQLGQLAPEVMDALPLDPAELWNRLQGAGADSDSDAFKLAPLFPL